MQHNKNMEMKKELEIIMEDEERRTDHLSNNYANKATEIASQKNHIAHIDRNSDVGKGTETNSLLPEQQHAFKANKNIENTKSNYSLLNLL